MRHNPSLDYAESTLISRPLYLVCANDSSQTLISSVSWQSILYLTWIFHFHKVIRCYRTNAWPYCNDISNNLSPYPQHIYNLERMKEKYIIYYALHNLDLNWMELAINVYYHKCSRIQWHTVKIEFPWKLFSLITASWSGNWRLQYRLFTITCIICILNDCPWPSL